MEWKIYDRKQLVCAGTLSLNFVGLKNPLWIVCVCGWKNEFLQLPRGKCFQWCCQFGIESSVFAFTAGFRRRKFTWWKLKNRSDAINNRHIKSQYSVNATWWVLFQFCCFKENVVKMKVNFMVRFEISRVLSTPTQDFN